MTNSTLNQNPGQPDPNFNQGNIGVTDSKLTGKIYSIAVQNDGKIIIGGCFSHYNGVKNYHYTRLQPNGTLDSEFYRDFGPNRPIENCFTLPDGKLLLCGTFSHFNDLPYPGMVRLNSDGSLDTDFKIDYKSIDDAAIQKDGKILLSGIFKLNEQYTTSFIRLNKDGTVDSDFNVGFIGNGYKYADLGFIENVKIQEDNKIIVGGKYTFINGIHRRRIARLEVNGMVDHSFVPGNGANARVTKSEIQQDGKIIITGQFKEFDGVPLPSFCRLNADGSLDNTFSIGIETNGWVKSILALQNGKIIIGGLFESYDGVPRNNIARLNSDGTLDLTFNPGTGTDGEINTIVQDSHNSVLIGGKFANYNGQFQNSITRIFI